MRKPARRTALLACTASDRIAGALARIKTQPRPKRPESAILDHRRKPSD